MKEQGFAFYSYICLRSKISAIVFYRCVMNSTSILPEVSVTSLSKNLKEASPVSGFMRYTVLFWRRRVPPGLERPIAERLQCEVL